MLEHCILDLVQQISSDMLRVNNDNLRIISPISDTSSNEVHCKTLSETLLLFPNLPLITCICTAASSKENRTPTWDLQNRIPTWAVTVMRSYLLNFFQSTGKGSTLAVSSW